MQYKIVSTSLNHMVVFKNVCCDVFVSLEPFNYFWKVLNPKTIKIYHVITISIQSHQMSSYSCVFVKTLYVPCPLS